MNLDMKYNPDRYLHKVEVTFNEYFVLPDVPVLLQWPNVPKSEDAEDLEWNPYHLTREQILAEELGLYYFNNISNEIEFHPSDLEAYESSLNVELKTMKKQYELKDEIEFYQRTKFTINFKEFKTETDMAIQAHSQYPLNPSKNQDGFLELK